MAETIQGGCKCGAARYSGERHEAADPFRCHCRDCQQLTGTGHSEMLPLIAARLNVTGAVTEFEMTGRSGKSTFSTFCPRCGSPLTRRSERSPDRVYVHAGSLDEPGLYQPARAIYTDAATPWDPPDATDDPA